MSTDQEQPVWVEHIAGAVEDGRQYCARCGLLLLSRSGVIIGGDGAERGPDPQGTRLIVHAGGPPAFTSAALFACRRAPDEREGAQVSTERPVTLSSHDNVLNALIAEAAPLSVDVQTLVVKAYAVGQKSRNMADYEQGYRDGESSREADVRIAVAQSASLEELITRLRGITGDPELELGSESGG